MTLLLQVVVLLSVLKVRILLLRRETNGGKGAADEVEARAERVRHAHENVLGTRARTVLRAARRRGRRVPAGVRPGGGHSGHFGGGYGGRRVQFGRGRG